MAEHANGQLGQFIGETKARLNEQHGKIEALWEKYNAMSDKLDAKITALDDKQEARNAHLLKEIRANQMTLAKWGGAIGAILTVLTVGSNLL